MTQTSNIKMVINDLLDEGMTDKQEIYNKVVERTGYPRPTVRRACRELCIELKRRAEILKPFGVETI